MRRFFSILLILAICIHAPAQDSLQVYKPGTLYSFGNTFKVYPEGFVHHKGQKLLLDGKASGTVEAGAESATFTLTDQFGASVSETLRIVCTQPGEGNHLVLCIGESTTETVNPNPWTGSFDSGWNWVSMMKALSESHGTQVSCLGTQTMAGAPLDACYTAHGGWSSYTYLNWPCAAKMDPGAPAHFFNSEAMWYALGLMGLTGKPFQGESWQYDLMAGVPFGKYPSDAHPSLIAFAKSVSGRYGFPVFTGSIHDWAFRLASNPVNEFYSLEAARKGPHAFSLEVYLERYRTMDDKGNRLESQSGNPAGEKVRGKDGKTYHIGTRIVSQALLNKVSVCRPQYVVVNIGINDGDSSSSIEATAASLQRLLECFQGLPISHFVMRWPGACEPALWAPEYLTRQYSIGGNSERVMAIMTLLAELSEGRSDLSLLDVWHCQTPVSQHQEKYAGGTLDCSINDVHPGYGGQMDAAYQVLGWLYSVSLPAIHSHNG